MQSVLIIQCFICKVSLLFSALNAKRGGRAYERSAPWYQTCAKSQESATRPSYAPTSGGEACRPAHDPRKEQPTQRMKLQHGIRPVPVLGLWGVIYAIRQYHSISPGFPVTTSIQATERGTAKNRVPAVSFLPWYRLDF